jgi:hypothetical protein
MRSTYDDRVRTTRERENENTFDNMTSPLLCTMPYRAIPERERDEKKVEEKRTFPAFLMREFL